jgi:hypothetical protein
MIILCDLGLRENFGPLWRARTWALERLISFDCASGDVRWAIVALALHSFTAAWFLLVRSLAGRVGRGACFETEMTDADSMVAAGGG